MLSADVRLEGFTATDWIRVLSLFRPQRAAGGERDPERPRGGVVAIHHGGQLKKLLHTEVGRLRLDDAARDWPLTAEDVAKRNHASWAASIESGTLEDVMDELGARAQKGDDLVAQALTLLSIARAELLAGRIDLWPRRLRGVPIPHPAVVRGSLDTVCPVGRVMVVGLFESGELWTSVALRRAADGFDMVLGPDEIRGEMGLLAGDWRRDYRHLARAIEQRVGPIALGLYAEASTLKKLEVDPTPGAWARAVAVRNVILHPLPAPLAIPLGIDAGRAAFGALRAIAERVDPVGVVGPGLAALRDFAVAATKSEPPKEGDPPLGFQPLDLLRRLLSREH